MREGGVEPPRPFGHRILSPARLPGSATLALKTCWSGESSEVAGPTSLPGLLPIYMGRYVAKNIVAAGLAERAQLQVAYAIGRAHPVSLSIETFGTSEVDPNRLEDVVSDMFDFRPAAIIEKLDLRRPIYLETAAYGHFGRKGFSWEETDRVDDLRRAFE